MNTDINGPVRNQVNPTDIAAGIGACISADAGPWYRRNCKRLITQENPPYSCQGKYFGGEGRNKSQWSIAACLGAWSPASVDNEGLADGQIKGNILS